MAASGKTTPEQYAEAAVKSAKGYHQYLTDVHTQEVWLRLEVVPYFYRQAHEALVLADQRHRTLRAVAADRNLLQAQLDFVTQQRDAERARADALYELNTDIRDQYQSLVTRTQDTDRDLETVHSYIDSRETVFKQAGSILAQQLSVLQDYRTAATELETHSQTARRAMRSVNELCDLIEVPVEDDRSSHARDEQEHIQALGTEDDGQFQNALEGDFSSEDDDEEQDEDEFEEDDETSLDAQSIGTGEYVPLPDTDQDFQSPPDNPPRQDEEDIDMNADTFGEEGDDDLDIN